MLKQQSCPISTNIRGGTTEVPIDNLDEPSVVAANLIQTLSWNNRKAKFIVEAEHLVMKKYYIELFP